jgi:hypothetical protein
MSVVMSEQHSSGILATNDASGVLNDISNQPTSTTVNTHLTKEQKKIVYDTIAEVGNDHCTNHPSSPLAQTIYESQSIALLDDKHHICMNNQQIRQHIHDALERKRNLNQYEKKRRKRQQQHEMKQDAIMAEHEQAIASLKTRASIKAAKENPPERKPFKGRVSRTTSDVTNSMIAAADAVRSVKDHNRTIAIGARDIIQSHNQQLISPTSADVEPSTPVSDASCLSDTSSSSRLSLPSLASSSSPSSSSSSESKEEEPEHHPSESKEEHRRSTASIPVLKMKNKRKEFIKGIVCDCYEEKEKRRERTQMHDTILQLVLRDYQQRDRINTLQEEKLKTELAILKAQEQQLLQQQHHNNNCNI